MSMLKQLSTLLGTAALLVAVTSCDDSTGPAAGGRTVTLSFAGAKPPGVGGAQAVRGALADSLIVVSGNDSLVITSVEIVLREIELKRQEGVIDCDSVADEDACEEFTLGAMLVNLPLAPGTSQELSVVIDTGVYTEVEFEVHKPGDDSTDQAFLAANPTWPDTVSIRVQGTFNGTPFLYVTDLNEEQEVALVPPLVITEAGTPTNLTIRLDVSSWFRQPGTGALIDPATANKGGQNENLVKDNIKNSIDAFEDEDRDGDETDED
jgi:hypothetical protein